jgi:hypothetical protein
MRRGRASPQADPAGRAEAVPTPSLRLGCESSSLRQAARDYVWLYDRRQGLKATEIAARDGVGEQTVRDGLRRARDLEAYAAELIGRLASCPAADAWDGLIPLFPIGAFTPQSECPHRGPITPGRPVVCMVCHASGADGGVDRQSNHIGR